MSGFKQILALALVTASGCKSQLCWATGHVRLVMGLCLLPQGIHAKPPKELLRWAGQAWISICIHTGVSVCVKMHVHMNLCATFAFQERLNKIMLCIRFMHMEFWTWVKRILCVNHNYICMTSPHSHLPISSLSAALEWLHLEMKVEFSVSRPFHPQSLCYKLLLVEVGCFYNADTYVHWELDRRCQQVEEIGLAWDQLLAIVFM